MATDWRFKNKYPVNRGIDESQQDNQEHVGSNYITGQVHVKKESKPLCNQDGEFLELCDRAAFDKVPAVQQCQRCRRSLGIDRYPGDIQFELSDNQKRLIMAIRQRTKESGGQWCPVAELCTKKTSSGWTSLHRSIRRLQHRGYIEKKLNAHNRALVRLTGRQRTLDRKRSKRKLAPGPQTYGQN